MVPEFLESGRRSMNHVLYAGLHVDLIAMSKFPAHWGADFHLIQLGEA